MEALAVLLLACFIACTIGVWLRTRAISLLLLIALLYNYVLHGYVVVFFHDVLGYSRENYWYDSAPYFVMLDRTYVEAMIVSLLFANAFILLWLLLPNPGHDLRNQDDTELSIDGWPVLIAGILCFAVGMVPWVSALERFMSEGTSSYGGFKSGEELGAYSGVLKLMLNITAMCVCVLVLAGIGMGERLTVRISRFVSIYWCFLIVLCLLFFASMTALGDRVSLIGGGLGACVLASFYRARKRRVVWLALLFLIPVATIGVTREMTEPKGIDEIVLGGIREIVDNGEASTVFPQYVAMANHIEAYSEGSLKYLGQIMIPKFLSADRPEQGPYEHFAAVAGFPEQTGWGMNFMTDCYVNYGYLAVVGGAILLGLLYRTLFQFARRRVKGQFIFAGAIAAFPLAIRSGIPGIKSVLVLALVGMLLYLLSVREARKV
jgi:hypothetical protein